jgi:hypothetical protein
MKSIYEVPVYCGRLKEWRVLNINTGTVYSCAFKTEEKAFRSIQDGGERGGKIVRRLALETLRYLLEVSGYPVDDGMEFVKGRGAR